jgi:protein-S-isoprenylcysteine O-methyltransferase Ste14
MNTTSQTGPVAGQPKNNTGILARFGQIVFGFILQALILFLASGRLDWSWAWLYLGINLVIVSINGALLMRTSPGTIAERGTGYKGMRDWDKLISGLWGLAQFLLIPLVSGLQRRFTGTEGMGIALHWAGAAVFALGLALFSWAMVANAYFSTAARIQEDRGQVVCRSGPYRFVRHPGYVGAILQSIGIPILLGSTWALIPGFAAIVLIVARTALEDRMLQDELPGYKEFTRDVRYRLLPGVW